MSISGADYRKCIELSERVTWKLDEVVPRNSTLDFSKSVMPSAMFFGHDLSFLNPKEKRTRNQIFSNSYRYLFYFVEAHRTQAH